jgi:hypothetical protein
MFGPRDHPQPTAPPSPAEELNYVLPPLTNALGAGEGRSRTARDHATRRNHRNSAGRRGWLERVACKCPSSLHVDTIVAVHIASLTCDYTLVQTVRGGQRRCRGGRLPRLVSFRKSAIWRSATSGSHVRLHVKVYRGTHSRLNRGVDSGNHHGSHSGTV